MNSLQQLATDTIVAAATPPGKGGVAIVRVSGSLTTAIAQKITRKNLQPNQAIYSAFYDNDGDKIDNGLALLFVSPASYTAEDVLELHCHGSPIIVDMLIKNIIANGARMAAAGEFTKRAFINGKLDLTQAEAVVDLINSASESAVKAANKTLQGEFSKNINIMIQQLISLRTNVEAHIDFSDEDIEFLEQESLKKAAEGIVVAIDKITATAKQGSLLQEGVKVAIVGEPNVGKSSLLNLLSAKEAAIVTDIAGTTRDLVRENISLAGVPLHVVDTAGIRVTDNIVEQEGIKRAIKEAQNADLVILMLSAADIDSEQKLQKNIQQFANQYDIKNNLFVIINKIDLSTNKPQHLQLDNIDVVKISILKQQGIELLQQQLQQAVGIKHQAEEGVFIARRRHLNALEKAKTSIIQGLNYATNKNFELFAEELKQGHLSLEEITGEFSTEDLLGEIFSNFCVGK